MLNATSAASVPVAPLSGGRSVSSIFATPKSMTRSETSSALRGDEHEVRGLDVAVAHARLVRAIEGVEGGAHEVEHLARGAPFAAARREIGFEGDPFEPLARHPRERSTVSLDRPVVEHADERRVVERREGPRLALEHREPLDARLARVAIGGREHLDRDGRVELDVTPAVHHPEAPASDAREHGVAPRQRLAEEVVVAPVAHRAALSARCLAGSSGLALSAAERSMRGRDRTSSGPGRVEQKTHIRVRARHPPRPTRASVISRDIERRRARRRRNAQRSPRRRARRERGRTALRADALRTRTHHHERHA
ncbi:MAG: hypothetical protein U0326_22060 [Polyangiales bacterium]